MLSPMLLVLAEQALGRAEEPSRQQMIEPVLIGLLLMCACAFVFVVWPWTSATAFHFAIIYLPLPLVLWLTVRFGIKGASGAVLIVTMTAISMAPDNVSTFGSASSDMNVLAQQLYLTGIAVPVLLLGAAVEGLYRAEFAIRELSRTPLSSQDEERRRTAKELHEGICQELAAASLIAGHIADQPAEHLKRNAQQLERQLHKSMQDLRSASYLLHPPLLDGSGLKPALSSFVEQFSRRTNIAVNLALSPDFGRLPLEIEISLFRFVQDALTNLCQHSNARTACICAELCGPDVVLTVGEEGLPPISRLLSLLRRVTFVAATGKQSVNMARMRERLHRIGGKLVLHSVGGKTVLRAVVRSKYQTSG